MEIIISTLYFFINILVAITGASIALNEYIQTIVEKHKYSFIYLIWLFIAIVFVVMLLEDYFTK